MKPNVIFLMDDQHRWDAMGHLNPQVRTPTLDRLAADGISFRQAVCQAPMCIASRNSMMLGMYANALGVLRNEPGIPDDKLPAPPLPELFRRAGYQTAGFGKTHWGLTCSTRGFEVRYEGECPENGAVMMKDDAPEAKRRYDAEIEPYDLGEENNAGYVGCTSSLPEEDHRDGWITGKCLDFIESGIDPQRPLFLYLSFFKPHAAHNVPAGYDDDFDTLDYATQPPWDHEISPHAAGNNRNGAYEEFWKKADPATWRSMTGRYYANCTWLDDMFGRALKALEAKGCLENALIVYCSDHGEMLGERYYRFNKYCFYEASVRVPIILSGSVLPPALHGVADERMAELVDLYPTLARIAGTDIPDTAQGLDLLSGPTRSAGFCALHERPDEAAFMWRTSLHKLILVMRRKPDAASYTLKEVIGGEFYDLVRDPKEWNNLYGTSGSHTAVMQAMTTELMAKLTTQSCRVH